VAAWQQERIFVFLKKTRIMIEFSEVQNSYFILPVLGFVVGVFGTMFGGGGGLLFIPLLTLWLGVPAKTAVLTSLVATLPIAIVGSIGHYRKNNIDLKVAAILISGGIIGVIAGARITAWITERELKVAFGVYSVLIGIAIAIRNFRKQQGAEKRGRTEEGTGFKGVIRGSFYGLVAGLITGTFGTSGTMPIMAGLFSLRNSLRIIIGTSLAVMLFNTAFAAAAHFYIGVVDLTLVSFLTAGSVLGALAGPGILAALKPERAEKSAAYFYGAVMVVIGILMILGSNHS